VYVYIYRVCYIIKLGHIWIINHIYGSYKLYPWYSNIQRFPKSWGYPPNHPAIGGILHPISSYLGTSVYGNPHVAMGQILPTWWTPKFLANGCSAPKYCMVGFDLSPYIYIYIYIYIHMYIYVCAYGCFHKWADPAYSNSWMVYNWKINLYMDDFLGTIISGNLSIYIYTLPISQIPCKKWQILCWWT